MARNGKSELLAAAVAGGSTIKSAAEQIGVAPSTAYKLSCETTFKRRVGELRTEAAAAAVGRLTTVAADAVMTLATLLSDDQPANIRLGAAKAILGSMVPMAEALELRQRVTELEQGIESQR